ncbi:adult-specific cuticular protein ACP-22-like [Lucilia sericata]|uniref:adult-specific cuticular protein ACP-22-like n=1 Tax=Lucilia sericata TaxID=13632 RepID=UPI0018A80BD8|nr:adult-specific cuticular protein ACP-22-like [Lucilia sericata]
MRFLHISGILLVGACGLVAGYYTHHGDAGHGGYGGQSKEVGYAVVTDHGHAGGHGGGHDGGHGGHDGGHADVHYAAGYYGGHDVADSHSISHYGGHSDGHYGGHGDDSHDYYAYPKYDFSYGVKDTKTGDIKSHSESRDGGNVKGSYSLKEADGTTRVVEYSADKHKGFNAVVHTLGHANGGHDAGHYYGHDDHYGHGYGHGYGHASSYIYVQKQEGKKH